MKYAILIDAGFLKRKLGSQAEPLDTNGVCVFLDALRAHEAACRHELASRVLVRCATARESSYKAVAGRDMRLGLDIAAITLKGHAQVFVLVAGDSGFVPAMKFARREGAQLFLVTLGHAVRGDMLEHSDLVLNVPAKEATIIPPGLAAREGVSAAATA